MSFTVQRFHGELDGVRRTGLTGVTFNGSVNVFESLPSDQVTTRKDPGSDSWDFSADGVVDDDFTDLKAIFNAHGTKIPFAHRPKDAAAAADNPEFGGNAVLELNSFSIRNGEGLEYSLTGHCDGRPTITP